MILHARLQCRNECATGRRVENTHGPSHEEQRSGRPGPPQNIEGSREDPRRARSKQLSWSDV